MDTKEIVLKFNGCINNRDIEGLVNLMTDDHIFIDSANNSVVGKLENKKIWKQFFDLFPDYQNVFESVRSEKSTVTMHGYSVCSDDRLNNLPAVWVAQVANDKVKEWRIYLNTDNNK